MNKSINLSFMIAREFGLGIVTGKYREKDVLPGEYDICKSMRVSRSVVREAIKILFSKGLITTRPSIGSVVEAEDCWNLFDHDVLQWLRQRKCSSRLNNEILQVRLAVEPMAAGLAAQKATSVHLNSIREAAQKLRDGNECYEGSITANLVFHKAVLEACGNRVYLQFVNFIETAIRLKERPDTQIDFSGYENLVSAICQGDEAQSQTLMKSILLSS